MIAPIVLTAVYGSIIDCHLPRAAQADSARRAVRQIDAPATHERAAIVHANRDAAAMTHPQPRPERQRPVRRGHGGRLHALAGSRPFAAIAVTNAVMRGDAATRRYWHNR